ncbi:MAG TPA: GTPase domain-containing protein [Acidimicrobiia bacterium]|nr:GTPase domain-containing protein [Acidimicrobiia bacterium]
MSQALRDLAGALQQRTERAPDPMRAERSERLRRHVVDYLAPRAANLAAPLVVVLLGSTGAGKSSLFNAIAGKQLSESGLLRPTTRRPVALVHPDDEPALHAGDLLQGLVSRDNLDLRSDAAAIAPGVVVVDAPDFDSVEIANRELAMELLEASDLVVFVTTVTRYADQIPWTVLARVRQRGVPLLAVLNRMPPDSPEATAVIADFRALLDRAELDRLGAFGPLEIVTVPEGAIDAAIDGLDRSAIQPILAGIETLRSDQEKRRAVIRRSLDNALQGLPAAVEEVAAEVDEEQLAAAALRRALETRFERARKALTREIENGTFLRSEVLRMWLEFVNAGPLTRYISEGVGRVAASIRGIFRPATPAPATEVSEAAFSDLVASVVHHVDTAAHQSSVDWSADHFGANALATDPGLWGASEGAAPRLDHQLDGWLVEIGEKIRVAGAERKGRAQAASISLNVLGTSAMLGVFLHTGGLTGAELGIGAATAVINQKLLEAVFGEANVSKFVSEASASLATILDEAFASEKRRFLEALGPLAEPTDLAERLRHAAHRAIRSVHE